MLRCPPFVLLLFLALLPGRADAAGSVTLISASGAVSVRSPGSKRYSPASAGSKIADRSRLKTGGDGKATLRFDDGSTAEVRPKSEIMVLAKRRGGDQPNGATLFFGRIWSKVAKAVGGETAFEVRSANAVAGVRGTQFEVGVADDGSARVIVREGAVAVEGDGGKPVNVGRGFEIESSHRGRLTRRKRAKRDPDWEGWFSRRAKKLERQGVEVAQDLDGRLSRRWRQVEKLVRRQRVLREAIQRLERQAKAGADVQADLEQKLAELERVTERLVSMRERLEAAFAMFERWGAMAERGEMKHAEKIGGICGNVARIAADFADMIEEGTDMSEESMNEMMEDMKNGPTLENKDKSAADELFE